jgi:hypothetical protein
MDTVQIKFSKPSTVPNMGCYRVGELATFSKELGDRIVARGHGSVVVPKAAAKAAPKTDTNK